MENKKYELVNNQLMKISKGYRNLSAEEVIDLFKDEYGIKVISDSKMYFLLTGKDYYVDAERASSITSKLEIDQVYIGKPAFFGIGYEWLRVWIRDPNLKVIDAMETIGREAIVKELNLKNGNSQYCIKDSGLVELISEKVPCTVDEVIEYYKDNSLIRITDFTSNNHLMLNDTSKFVRVLDGIIYEFKDLFVKQVSIRGNESDIWITVWQNSVQSLTYCSECGDDPSLHPDADNY